MKIIHWRQKWRSFWERVEDPSYQKRYSLFFTVGIHIFLLMILFGQVQWQIKPLESDPIGIRYAEELPPPTPTPTTEIAPPIENVISDPTALSLPSNLPKNQPIVKPIIKPIAKAITKDIKPITKTTEKTNPKTATKVDLKKNTQPEKDPLAELIARSTETTTEVDMPKNPSSKSEPNKPVSATGMGSGDQGSGKGSSSIDTEQAQYKEQIQRVIRTKINYPEGITNNPQVELMITQDKGGAVKSVIVKKSSGIPAFDDAVIRAVHAASPLPLPQQNTHFSQSFKLVWKRFEE